MRSYIDLFRIPGITRLVLSIIPGRIAYAMLGLATFFYVHKSSGSIALAGLATGAEMLASSLTAGFRGHFIDKYGQTIPLSIFMPTWAFFVAVFSQVQSPFWILTTAAFIGLTSPPVNLASRPLWRTAVPAEQIRAAYALDTTLMNTTLVIGPFIATALALSVSESFALWTTATSMLLGGGLMISMPLSRNWVPEPNPGGALTALRHKGFRILAFEGALFGLGWGVLEIAIPSSATMINQPGLSAPLVATLAAASVVGGLMVGSFKKSVTPMRGLKYASLGMTTSAFFLIPSHPGISMGVALAFLGLAGGFAMVYHWEVIETVRPEGTATTAQAWLWTVEGSMIAVGSSIGGYIAETFGSTYAFICVAVGLSSSALFIWLYAAPRLPQADRHLSDIEEATALANSEPIME